MIYIISNLHFGHPKLFKHQIEYFENYFIPNLNKKLSAEDKLIINGDIFHNTNQIQFSILSKFKDIIDKINMPIEIIGNNYCFDIISSFGNATQTNQTFNSNINLFQLSKEDKNKIGFEVIIDGKSKFVENKISPRFIDISVDKIEDIDNVMITKNFIDLIVNTKLIKIPEYKNRIDIFLSKHDFNNIYYVDDNVEEETIVIKNMDKLNIRNILVDNIEKDLKNELFQIFEIFDSK